MTQPDDFHRVLLDVGKAVADGPATRHHHTIMNLDPKYYGLIEMGLTFGITLLFTVQQLWSLRDKKPAKEPDKDPPEA